MIENLKIITGTPTEVQAKVQTYLSSHPKAEILSSAVTVHHEHATPAVALSPIKEGEEDKPRTAKAVSKPGKAITTVSVIVGLNL